jgi:glutamyl-tRNA reductase
MRRTILAGLNHKTAPVHVREQVAFSPSHLGEALRALSGHVPQGVIISTCNRTEVYTVCNSQPSYDRLFEFLSDHSGIPVEELLPYLYTLEDDEAVRHLFRVAAGLESMILGEYEVLGQVKQALEEAQANKVAAYPLADLFRQAVAVGRRVREETDISKNAASVSSAAVGLAREVFGDLENCQVLLVGAGEAGTLVAKALVKIGSCKLTVTNRSLSKAASLADEVGGTAIAFHQLRETLAHTDILISCSGAPHYIIEPEVVRQSTNARSGQPMLLIDIAVPRDIDPAVKEVAGVTLYDIDALNSVVNSNRELREMEAGKAVAIIEAEVDGFAEWQGSRDKAPVIKALVGRAEEIRVGQLTRTIGEISTLSLEDQERLDAMTRAIVKKILHSPISCLKKQNGNHVDMIREIFDLEA